RGVNRAPQHDTLQLLAAALCLSAQDREALSTAAGRGDGSDPEKRRMPDLRTARPVLPPLVGRDRECHLLQNHLAGPPQGAPVVLLAGEPGIGKTRLLREVTQQAGGFGLRVLEGGCQRRGGQDPYAPLLGALQGHLRRRPAADLRPALRGCAW